MICQKHPAEHYANFLIQVLSSVPGRDKVFKIIQYAYSFRAWRAGFDEVDFGVRADESYSSYERNAMSIQNTRRLFKIGRFIGEWERIHTALVRCSELLHYAEQSFSVVVFIQFQMLLDIAARLLGCLKSVLDDVLYFSRIEVLNPVIHRPLERLCPRIGIPVILIDIFLHSLKLAQFIENALSGHRVRHRKSFSLLARYELNAKRKSVSNNLPPMFQTNVLTSTNWIARQGTATYPLLNFTEQTPPVTSLHAPQMETPPPMVLEGEVVEFSASETKRAKLERLVKQLWRKLKEIAVVSVYNREIYWCWLTVVKLCIDLTVGLSYAFHLKGVHRGHITVLAMVSGLLNVCKIGNGM